MTILVNLCNYGYFTASSNAKRIRLADEIEHSEKFRGYNTTIIKGERSVGVKLRLTGSHFALGQQELYALFTQKSGTARVRNIYFWKSVTVWWGTSFGCKASVVLMTKCG